MAKPPLARALDKCNNEIINSVWSLRRRPKPQLRYLLAFPSSLTADLKFAGGVGGEGGREEGGDQLLRFG